jgi:large subunit ribosomal protein L22
MNVKSTYKYARISPFKAREVAREIQGLPVSVALDILTFTQRKAASLIGKTMRAAIADAENNFELDLETLTVKEAVIGDGPTFKRFKPRARGSASPIRKRTSHIYVTLTDEAPLPEPKQKSSGGKKKKKAKAQPKPAAKKDAAEEKPKDDDVKAEEAEAEVKVDDAAAEVEVAETPAEEPKADVAPEASAAADAEDAAAEPDAEAGKTDAKES